MVITALFFVFGSKRQRGGLFCVMTIRPRLLIRRAIYWNKILEEVAGAKNYSTKASHVVSHRTTDFARKCLSSQIERDAEFSPLYGRRYHITRVLFIIFSAQTMNCWKLVETISRQWWSCGLPPLVMKQLLFTFYSRFSPVVSMIHST
jgi:hypothetical protein